MLKYHRIHHSTYNAYVLNGFDVNWLLKKIQFYRDNNTPPFYSSVPNRKTFYDEERNVYIKIVDESWKRFGLLSKWLPFHKTSDKYLKFYKVLEQLQISTPKLLACMKIKKDRPKSVIATEGIADAQSMISFSSSLPDSTMKAITIQELAKTAAFLHGKGYYFSMEPRNIFVKVKDRKAQLYLLDLEHMKPAGLFFKRRIKRNLRRFKGSLMFEANKNLDDWNTFMGHYKNAFTPFG